MTAIVIEKARPEEYRALHAVADRLVPSLRRALLDAVDRVNGRLKLGELALALERGDVSALQRMGIWQELDAELRAALRPVLERAVTGAGQASVERMPPSIQAQMQFDLTNPYAIAAVDTQVAAIVRELVNVDATAIQRIIRQGFTEGLTPREMARRIREYLGLTPQYVDAVERYRDGLEEQDVKPGRVDELAEDYAARLRRLRALNIARTETIRASNLGQQAAWNEAADRGLLDRDKRRFWIITPDDRLCPICEDIPSMNPDGVGLNENFRTSVGPVFTPPAHPQCRCATGLIT